MTAHNKKLGMFELSGLPPAPHGVPQIEITFDIDANGVLVVGAKELSTSKEHTLVVDAKAARNRSPVDSGAQLVLAQRDAKGRPASTHLTPEGKPGPPRKP